MPKLKTLDFGRCRPGRASLQPKTFVFRLIVKNVFFNSLLEEVAMLRNWPKSLFYLGSLFACGLMALSTGCASGGYKLTREYAKWVNSKSLIIRIILYILTTVVFGVTLLIDAVVFNTIDFWNGTVSGGKLEFKEGERVYQVNHEILPGTNLKRSTIKVLNADGSPFQLIVLNETTSGEIEFNVDGKTRTRVRNITSIPIASLYDTNGKLTDEKFLLLDVPTMNLQNVAKH